MKLPESFTIEGLREQWREMVIPSWLVSVLAHTVALVVLSFLFMEPPTSTVLDDLETELARIAEQPNLDEIRIDPLPLEPPQTLDVPTPEEPTAASVAVSNPSAESAPLSPVDMPALDNMASLLSGLNPSGSAAKGAGGLLNSRGADLKAAMVGSQGGTKQTEQAVNAGLSWLLRHQFTDGHWGLHELRCTRGHCSGVGVKGNKDNGNYDMAGTAFGLLPFLAANYTHQSGPYQKPVRNALDWMIDHQDAQTGSLAHAANENMYVHGIATIVLCEAYALTRDRQVGAAAQKAIRFIEYAQHPVHGGWRYVPRQEVGDTSVVGWQVMALKSAQMGGLEVKPAALDGAKKFLRSVARGRNQGLYRYDAGNDPRFAVSPSLTAVGLLCQQYLGAARSDASMKEGLDYLKANPPSLSHPDWYYWYYATQVMHNVQGSDWDRWNREMRTIWVETQARDKSKCDFGSWDPARQGGWGNFTEVGGRHMITSIGLLTLEVYYRYLPLYKVMGGDADVAATK